MIVSYEIDKTQVPTKEQQREIQKAAEIEYAYDEECPFLSAEQLTKYHQAAIRKRNGKIPSSSCSKPEFLNQNS